MESLERSCFAVVHCFVYCKQRVNSMTSKLEISEKINQKSRVVKSYRKLAPFSAITSRFPLMLLLSFYVDSRFQLTFSVLSFLKETQKTSPFHKEEILGQLLQLFYQFRECDKIGSSRWMTVHAVLSLLVNCAGLSRLELVVLPHPSVILHSTTAVYAAW